MSSRCRSKPASTCINAFLFFIACAPTNLYAKQPSCRGYLYTERTRGCLLSSVLNVLMLSWTAYLYMHICDLPVLKVICSSNSTCYDIFFSICADKGSVAQLCLGRTIQLNTWCNKRCRTSSKVNLCKRRHFKLQSDLQDGNCSIHHFATRCYSGKLGRSSSRAFRL